jgi:Tfp pilus assembly protein PilV
VLIALVILAVGILALEALGIYAVRSVAQASRNSRSAAVATRYLEDALHQIRQDTATPGGCLEKLLTNGDRVTRIVTMANTASVPSQVDVTVIPEPRGRPPRPYSISGHVYFPAVVGKNKPGRACP